MTHREWQEEIAAYLLGALDERAVRAVEAHLEECAICRAECERLRVASESLSLAAEQYEAPSEVGERVMRVVRSEAQLLQAASPDEPQPAAKRRWRRPGWLGRGWTPPLALGALATVLVIGVLALAGVFSGGGTSSRTISAQLVGVQGASAALRVQDGRGQLIVAHMAQPPAGRIYEVWVQRPGRAPQPTPALFGVTRSGSAEVAVPGSLSGVQRVLVTDEPLGGSQVPTRMPVIVVSAT
jgi:anti-sigma-K factor RskA